MDRTIIKKAFGLVILVFLAAAWAVSLPPSATAGPPVSEIKKRVMKMVETVKKSTPHITAKEFKKVLDRGEKIILVDVRTKAEYDAAHLPGAIHIDRGLLEWVAPMIIKDTDARIYVYCRTGARSAFATKRLMEMGYTNVTNIYDAFRGWVMEGYPVYNRHGEFRLMPDAFEKRETRRGY